MMDDFFLPKPQLGTGEFSVHSKCTHLNSLSTQLSIHNHHLYNSLAATTPLFPYDTVHGTCVTVSEKVYHIIHVHLKYLYCNTCSSYPFSFSVHLVLEDLI